MTGLSDSELERLGVADDLREAIGLARNMKASGARNRQLKHCVRLIDEDQVRQVRVFLDDRQSRQVETNQVFHELERWRDRLIEEGDEALSDLLRLYGDIDRQHARRLCRDATRERATGKPAGAGRQLFRWLREIFGA
jgi:ribosome-associated protein